MSELGKRVSTAAILAPLAVWWLLFSPSPWFELLLGMLALAALFELIVMLKLPMRAGMVFAGGAATVLVLLSQQVAPAIILLGVVWTGLLVLSVRRVVDAPVSEWTFRFGMLYWLQIWLLLFVWVLQQQHSQPHGPVFLLGAFIGVWAADIGAYFVGRALGRRKLCPAISPGKTLEGAIAGGVFGIAACSLIWVVFAQMSVLASLFIGLALVVSAVLGDLAESAIKRAVGVKDSGRMLPGHGGLLDRVDALIPAVAVAGVLGMAL